MSDSKFDKACRLYLAMSELDDKTATDALRYRRTASNGIRVAIIMAACLTLVVGTTLMGTVFARFVGGSADQAPDSPTQASESATLSSVLNEYRFESNISESTSTTLPKLINSTPSIIWKYQDSDEYHVKAIGDAAFNTLVSEIKQGTQVEDNDAELDCLVWIASGNGKVYSPYLKPSDGNVGYGVLFEYDPELEPTEKFVSAVSKLLD